MSPVDMLSRPYMCIASGRISQSSTGSVRGSWQIGILDSAETPNFWRRTSFLSLTDEPKRAARLSRFCFSSSEIMSMPTDKASSLVLPKEYRFFPNTLLASRGSDGSSIRLGGIVTVARPRSSRRAAAASSTSPSSTSPSLISPGSATSPASAPPASPTTSPASGVLPGASAAAGMAPLDTLNSPSSPSGAAGTVAVSASATTSPTSLSTSSSSAAISASSAASVAASRPALSWLASSPAAATAAASSM
mmetsp:Transcript_26603/g.69964  ORF Transcript_26603/g.69964 Transcript_26603/m.69964 type:complete len:249 (-) Transcript_26603:184-930(-)